MRAEATPVPPIPMERESNGASGNERLVSETVLKAKEVMTTNVWRMALPCICIQELSLNTRREVRR